MEARTHNSPMTGAFLMRKFIYINMIAVITALTLGALPAHATGWIDHFFRTDTDFRPYLENDTDSHDRQWRRDPWQAAHWAPDTSTGMHQIDRFFQSGILARYKHANWLRSPTVTVGPSFYRLSGFDQRRVMDTFDHVYRATAHEAGTIFLQDGHTGRTIGLYVRGQGLQLQ